MDEYPDPDEEFELMYQDDLDALRDLEDNNQSFEYGNCSNPTKSQSKEDGASLDIEKSCVNLSIAHPTHNLSNGTDTASNLHSTENIINASDRSGSPICNNVTQPIDMDLIEADNTSTSLAPKKRTIRELFGDIDDILNEEIVDGKVIKRKKDRHTNDFALIAHIVELRKLAKLSQNHVGMISKDHLYSNENINKRNISRTVPKYSFVAITRENGERVYVRCHSEEYEHEEMKKIGKDTFKGVMGDSFKDIWNEAKLEINKILDKNNCNITEEVETDISDGSVIKKSCEVDTSLWVDLYKPQKYLELLSDESTNRTLLRWLKLWDKIVFNKKPKTKIIKEDVPKTDASKTYFKKPELNTNLDENGFPEKRVALLCGPPGLGKTTLAHMIATHAGYHVIEVNASDDRTADKFRDILEKATQMRSVVDPHKRPNCVIFDEIDGAPQAAIEFLVKFITGGATKKKKGVTKANVLRRPIICICNDVYVPALKPLRQIAFVVNFPPTASVRLAERLNEIAKHQQIKIDIGALLALCEKTGNDIRSCLAALNFFKTQYQKVTVAHVHNTSVGQKDMQKSLFAVWQSIFYIERPNINVNQTNNIQYDGSLKARMHKVLQIVNNFGDYEKLAQGIFENYPNLGIKDTTFITISEALEWFCFSDLLNTQIYKLQNYTLLSYLSYSFVMWHFIFGSSTRPKLNYPSANYEAKVKSAKNIAILHEVMKGMHPSIRAYTYSNSLKMDTLPLLSQIVVPPFRPVNLYLYSQQEKDMLQQIVNIMIDYNLSYEQERAVDGSYSFNIDPNINEITSFSTSKSTRVLSYSNKQLVAREIDVEKIRRAELHKNKGVVNSQPGKATTVQKSNNILKETTSNLPNHLQRLKPKSVSPKGSGGTKVDKGKKNGEGGSQNSQLDEFDLVFAVIGKKSLSFPKTKKV